MLDNDAETGPDTGDETATEQQPPAKKATKKATADDAAGEPQAPAPKAGKAKKAAAIDEVMATQLVGVPASLFNSNAELRIGSATALYPLDGRASLCFLCAAYLSDATIRALFGQTRGLFRV